jgi:hypothetical protein
MIPTAGGHDRVSVFGRPGLRSNAAPNFISLAEDLSHFENQCEMEKTVSILHIYRKIK